LDRRHPGPSNAGLRPAKGERSSHRFFEQGYRDVIGDLNWFYTTRRYLLRSTSNYADQTFAASFEKSSSPIPWSRRMIPRLTRLSKVSAFSSFDLHRKLEFPTTCTNLASLRRLWLTITDGAIGRIFTKMLCTLASK